MSKKGIPTESYKGVRDFYPEDMAVQNYIFSKWRKVVEEAGYVEYGASILEYADLYRSKGSDEIVNTQMYTFKDKGDREVALRPEMTPTLARMIAAKRKGLKLPLRWYSIPNVFRYERPQRGRRREHWQLNCDLVGIPGIDGDVEIISLAYKIMKEFGAKDEDFVIRINTSTAIDSVIKELHSDKDENWLSKWIPEIKRLMDKQGKIDERQYQDTLKSYLGNRTIEEFHELLDSKSSQEIDSVISKLNDMNIKNVIFDRKLTRGFDYYTGIVFEVFDTNSENKRSLFGGGRYDNLLEMFGVEPLPTVGFGMGDITIRDFLETHKLPLIASKNL